MRAAALWLNGCSFGNAECRSQGGEVGGAAYLECYGLVAGNNIYQSVARIIEQFFRTGGMYCGFKDVAFCVEGLVLDAGGDNQA